MGRRLKSALLGTAQGYCCACKDKFVGPGDRCPKCVTKLRARQRRKRR